MTLEFPQAQEFGSGPMRNFGMRVLAAAGLAPEDREEIVCSARKDLYQVEQADEEDMVWNAVVRHALALLQERELPVANVVTHFLREALSREAGAMYRTAQARGLWRFASEAVQQAACNLLLYAEKPEHTQQVAELVLQAGAFRAYVLRATINAAYDLANAESKEEKREEWSIGEFRNGDELGSIEKFAPDGKASVLEQLLAAEERPEQLQKLARGREAAAATLRVLATGAGKDLARTLVEIGTERGLCQGPIATLNWLWCALFGGFTASDHKCQEELVKSGYLKSNDVEVLKSASLSREVVARMGVTRCAYDLARKRLKANFRAVLQSAFGKTPVENRKRYIYRVGASASVAEEYAED